MVLLFALALYAQDPVLRFEVASIKPSDPATNGSNFSFNRGTGLTTRNATVKALMEMAYDVRSFQIAGGPGWLETDHYDIAAKNATDDPTPPLATYNTDALRPSRLRLQALLAERFQLKIHRETKELPAYALVAAKGGAKLEDRPGDDPNSGITTYCGRIVANHIDMETVALVLSREVGRPVIDRTGLKGRYDFKLTWTPDSGPCSAGTPERPSLFAALQEDLGLRLEAIKAPTEIIVIDSAAKPTAN